MASHRRGIVAAIATVLTAGSLAVLTPGGPAAAAPVDRFYLPPTALPADAGAVVKTRPTAVLLQIPAFPRPFPGAARTVMYTSRLQDGTPTAVTGTFIEPFVRWRGRGPQPTVVMAPGTVGQGDQCAPSKLIATSVGIDPSKPSIGLNYEIPFATALLASGYKVFMTDYIGLGTPGVHTYVNRVEEAHAVLDGARAALRLGRAPSNAPVAFWGYSQGGGASAAAAELASTYAPELNVRGTYAGAPPADLVKVLARVDGSSISGVIGYTVNALLARYPDLRPIIAREASPSGRRVLAQLAGDCVGDTALRFGFRSTRELTTARQPLSALVARYPQVLKAIDEQRIGRLRPNAPVLVDTGVNDDIIPHGQVLTLVSDWRAKGADVRLITDTTPPIFPRLALNHALPYLLSAAPALQFLQARFNG
nr:lipase family protein [Williamsia sp. CHRR-6]